jgi:small subunit ribosomal protein S18
MDQPLLVKVEKDIFKKKISFENKNQLSLKASPKPKHFKNLKQVKRFSSVKRKKQHIVAIIPQKSNLLLRRVFPKETIDYKNVSLLRRCITIEGKILPRRTSGLNAKQQRYISKAIKTSRIVGLLPFVNKSR